MSEIAVSEPQRLERLSALVACDGSARRAVKRLKDQGVEATVKELETLREQHSGAYMTIASERARAQEEALAQGFRESASTATRVTTRLLEKIDEELDSGHLSSETQRMLPQIMQGAAKVSQVSTDKLLALTGRPVNGETRDPMESARELIRMGVLVPSKEPRRIDAEATVEEG